jgi:putative tricarboxylic transport membrane protein
MTAERAGEPVAESPGVVGPGWRYDVVAGLLAAAVGAAVVLHVRTFPELPDGAPGPALFPGIVGALLLVFGLVLAVRAVLARGREAVRHGVAATPRGRLQALGVLGFVAAYLLLAEVLGFPLTMAVLLFLLMWLLGARLWVAAAAAVVTTGVILLLFQELLLVPLPTGFLG